MVSISGCLAITFGILRMWARINPTLAPTEAAADEATACSRVIKRDDLSKVSFSARSHEVTHHAMTTTANINHPTGTRLQSEPDESPPVGSAIPPALRTEGIRSRTK